MLEARLSFDEKIRSWGVTENLYEWMGHWYERDDQIERLAISRGHIDEQLMGVVNSWLSSAGYEMDPYSDEFNQFAREYAKAQSLTTKAIYERQQGSYVATEEVLAQIPRGKTVSAPSKQTSSGLTLSTVINYFLDNYNKSNSMYRKHKAALGLFMELLNLMAFSNDLKKKQLVAY